MNTIQRENAINTTKNWLKYNKKFGKEPSEIEIADTFIFRELEYAILKFKKEDDGKWLFALCGGYLLTQNAHCGIIWSELEEYVPNEQADSSASSLHKCKEYLENNEESKKRAKQFVYNDLFDRIIVCHNERRFQDVFELVDSNLMEYRQMRTKNGVPCYQFKDLLAYLFYKLTHKNEKFIWASSNELNLLLVKMYTLTDSKQYKKALELIDELMKISPNYIILWFEKIHIAEAQNNLVEWERLLKDIYPNIWWHVDYSKFLHSHARLAIKKGDVKHALYCLILSSLFDTSDHNWDEIEDECKEIGKQFNLPEFSMPTYLEVLEYFSNFEYFKPTQQIIDFCSDLYIYLLQNKDTVGKKWKDWDHITHMAEENLIRMYDGDKLYAKAIEVLASTPNYLEINTKMKFTFQSSKIFDLNKIDKSLYPNKLYELVNKNNEIITISKCGTFNTEEQFNEIIDLHKNEDIKSGFEIISSEKYVSDKNQIKAIKVLEKNSSGDLFVNYWFKMSLAPSEVGRVSAQVSENNSELEKEILTIIDTWEYITE